MILNKDNFPHLNVFTHAEHWCLLEYRTGNAIFDLRDWNDRDYWYIDFMRSEVFDYHPVESLVPEDVLEKIKTDDTTFLLLSNTHEAFHSIVDGLYERVVIKSKIPPRKIILMNESRDLHLEVKKVAEKYKCEPMNVFWSLLFEFGLKLQATDHFEALPKTLTHKRYDKKYLNFNRRWRMHRPLIVALLIGNNLLDKGYVSLGDSDDNCNWEQIFWMLEQYVRPDPELSRIFSDYRDVILNTKPLYLDKHNLKENWVRQEYSTKYLYENSLFSLVNETNFFSDKTHFINDWIPIEPSRFLSEKALKPVANFHPFIIASVPRFLETMRELGYKTFHPFIDETYDTIDNDYDRLKAIIKEVNRLSNMTETEEYEFIENVKPIVQHNLRNLLNKTQWIYKTL